MGGGNSKQAEEIAKLKAELKAAKEAKKEGGQEAKAAPQETAAKAPPQETPAGESKPEEDTKKSKFEEKKAAKKEEIAEKKAMGKEKIQSLKDSVTNSAVDAHNTLREFACSLGAPGKICVTSMVGPDKKVLKSKIKADEVADPDLEVGDEAEVEELKGDDANALTKFFTGRIKTEAQKLVKVFDDYGAVMTDVDSAVPLPELTVERKIGASIGDLDLAIKLGVTAEMADVIEVIKAGKNKGKSHVAEPLAKVAETIEAKKDEAESPKEEESGEAGAKTTDTEDKAAEEKPAEDKPVPTEVAKAEEDTTAGAAPSDASKKDQLKAKKEEKEAKRDEQKESLKAALFQGYIDLQQRIRSLGISAEVEVEVVANGETRTMVTALGVEGEPPEAPDNGEEESEDDDGKGLDQVVIRMVRNVNRKLYLQLKEMQALTGKGGIDSPTYEAERSLSISLGPVELELAVKIAAEL